MEIKKVEITKSKSKSIINTINSKGIVIDSYFVSDNLVQAFLNVSKRKSISK